MFFFYLYLGHLLSDYVFQPQQLVEWKHKSNWGIFTHALVHFLVTGLLVYFYTASYFSLLLALFLAATHFCIDYFKVSHDNKNTRSHQAYWIDQLLHFLVILGTALVIYRYHGPFVVRAFDWSNYFDALFFNPIFATYSCVAIFSTLTIEYSYFHLKLGGKHHAAPVLSARHMLKRLFLFTLVYIGLLFSLVPSVGFYY